MRNLTAAIAASAILVISPSASTAGEFAIDGAMPCARVNASQDQSLAAMLWVQGYLSGSNAYRQSSGNGKMLLLPSKDEVRQKVDAFCRQNPSGNTFHAAATLWKGIERK